MTTSIKDFIEKKNEDKKPKVVTKTIIVDGQEVTMEVTILPSQKVPKSCSVKIKGRQRRLAGGKKNGTSNSWDYMKEKKTA